MLCPSVRGTAVNVLVFRLDAQNEAGTSSAENSRKEELARKNVAHVPGKGAAGTPATHLRQGYGEAADGLSREAARNGSE